jgi:hypothetical protein
MTVTNGYFGLKHECLCNFLGCREILIFMGVKLSEDTGFKVHFGTQISAINCAFQRSFQLFHSKIYNLLTYVKNLAKKYPYLLTPWSRVLLEKLTGLHPVKEFPAFYGTRRFITAFTSARHLSLSLDSSSQSIPPHPTS